MSSENPTPSLASDHDLLNEQAILCEFLDTIDSDDSDNDVVVSSASVYSAVSIHPNKERILNVVRAVILPATAASSARRRIGTFTGLLVPLWPRSWFCESLNSLPQEHVHICTVLALGPWWQCCTVYWL